MDQLFSNYPKLSHSWSADNYACWIEESLPQGFENFPDGYEIIDVGSYPDFKALRMRLRD